MSRTEESRERSSSKGSTSLPSGFWKTRTIGRLMSLLPSLATMPCHLSSAPEDDADGVAGGKHRHDRHELLDDVAVELLSGRALQ